MRKLLLTSVAIAAALSGLSSGAIAQQRGPGGQGSPPPAQQAAPAQPAQAEAPAPNRPNNSDNRDRRDNTGAVAAGVVAGVLLGNAINQGGYGPAGSYPAYGDQHYGDPRYDPRYAQGGWGYGHRPGEWVSIGDRAEWLGRQIEDGDRDGALSHYEARKLRQQLDSLRALEVRYSRKGLNNRERAELDQRFDQLAARIQQERRDHQRRNDDHYDHYDRH